MDIYFFSENVCVFMETNLPKTFSCIKKVVQQDGTVLEFGISKEESQLN